MKKCDVCGHENDPWVNYCEKCGAELGLDDYDEYHYMDDEDIFGW